MKNPSLNVRELTFRSFYVGSLEGSHESESETKGPRKRLNSPLKSPILGVNRLVNSGCRLARGSSQSY